MKNMLTNTRTTHSTNTKCGKKIETSLEQKNEIEIIEWKNEKENRIRDT